MTESWVEDAVDDHIGWGIDDKEQMTVVVCCIVLMIKFEMKQGKRLLVLQIGTLWVKSRFRFVRITIQCIFCAFQDFQKTQKYWQTWNILTVAV